MYLCTMVNPLLPPTLINHLFLSNSLTILYVPGSIQSRSLPFVPLTMMRLIVIFINSFLLLIVPNAHNNYCIHSVCGLSKMLNIRQCHCKCSHRCTDIRMLHIRRSVPYYYPFFSLGQDFSSPEATLSILS